MNLASKLKNMPFSLKKIIEIFSIVCAKRKVRGYLVGGSVRDLILGVKNWDLDFVVEKDVFGVGVDLVKRLKRDEYIYRPEFLTFKIKLDSGFIDVAGMRKEFYPYRGALPQVAEGSLEEDCKRRDFTINALYISLNKDSFGEVIDLCAGIEDLKRRYLRVFHSASFLDDPTRILRGIKFKERLNFKFEPSTFFYLKEAVRKNALKSIDLHRVKEEFVLLFEEKEFVKILKSIHKICSLEYIHKNIKFCKEDFIKLRKVLPTINKLKEYISPLDRESIYWSLILKKIPSSCIDSLCSKMGLKAVTREVLREYKKVRSRINYLQKTDNLGKLYTFLKSLRKENILLLFIEIKDISLKRKLVKTLKAIKEIKLEINGEDVKTLGIKEGPLIGRILSQVLYKKIQGSIKGYTQELEYARQLILKYENRSIRG